MKGVSVRELCENWKSVLQQHVGTEVGIKENGKIVAYLRVPAPKAVLRKGHKVKIPDFRKRIKARFGDRMLTKEDVEWLDEMRGRY